MRTTLKRLARFGGLLLSLLCIVFVGYRLSRVWAALPDDVAWSGMLASLPVAVAIYALAGVLLAPAWWLCLRAAEGGVTRFRDAAVGHLSAQIAKYLPGNVLHFVVRHAHARRHGGGHFRLAGAAVLESVLLVAAALSWSLALPNDSWPGSLNWLGSPAWLAIAAFGFCITLACVWWLANRRLVERAGNQAVLAVVGALLCYLVFFGLCAASYDRLLADHVLPISALAAAVAVCWLGGFIVPGAPGGLGVREALLVVVLGPTIGESAAVVSAIAFRITTIFGDVIAALIGRLLKRRALEE